MLCCSAVPGRKASSVALIGAYALVEIDLDAVECFTLSRIQKLMFSLKMCFSNIEMRIGEQTTGLVSFCDDDKKMCFPCKLYVA